MKRSEMLEIIEKAFDETSIVNTPPHYHILNCIEKARMLPPYRNKTKEEKTEIDAINQYDYCHQWEEENEKK